MIGFHASCCLPMSVVVFFLNTSSMLSAEGLSLSNVEGSNNHRMATSNGLLNPADDAFMVASSPAMSSIQETDVARLILEQRSTRGRPRQLRREKSSPRKLQRRRSVVERSPSKQGQDGRDQSTSSELTNTKAVRNFRACFLSYESAVQALKVYHKKHSHLVMPRKYIITEIDEYPKEWHGVDLAATVYDMKWWLCHVKERPDRVAELNKLGFVWERLQPEFNLILEALITYRTLNDDLLVPSKFVVPFGDDNWSKACWGLSLGKAVYRIRSRGDFLRGSKTDKRRMQLNALGFVWDIQEHRFEIFCHALRIYARNDATTNAPRKSGALKIPSQFVVPETKAWPQSLWRYPLGAKCTAVRQKGLYVKGEPERLRMLAEIGFHRGGNDSLSWLEVVHAAAIYSQMHNRNLDVPQHFVVPAPPQRKTTGSETMGEGECVVGSDDAWPWPEYLWGFPLGQRLRDIRLKGYYLRGDSSEARKRQLDALGFNWNPKAGRRKRT